MYKPKVFENLAGKYIIKGDKSVTVEYVKEGKDSYGNDLYGIYDHNNLQNNSEPKYRGSISQPKLFDMFNDFIKIGMKITKKSEMGAVLNGLSALTSIAGFAYKLFKKK
jgi:hypothetical protein